MATNQPHIRSPDTAAVMAPPMFRSEYEQELELWLRRRFGYLCMAYLIIEVIGLIATVFATLAAPAAALEGVPRIKIALISSAGWE